MGSGEEDQSEDEGRIGGESKARRLMREEEAIRIGDKTMTFQISIEPFGGLEIGTTFEIVEDEPRSVGLKIGMEKIFLLSGPLAMETTQVRSALEVVKLGRVGTFAPGVTRSF